MRKFVLLALLARTLSAQTEPEIRKAVERALPVLESSVSSFVAKRACVSCHHNTLAVLMLHLARERGVKVDAAALAAVEDKTFRSLRDPAAFDDAVQATTLADPTPDDSFLLMAAHAAGLPPDLTTAVYARRLASWQRDGHWVTSDFRPPHSSSVFTATASAVRAIGLYMPVELTAERDECLLKARRWLITTHPVSTEDASFRLMGLVWAGATRRGNRRGPARFAGTSDACGKLAAVDRLSAGCLFDRRGALCIARSRSTRYRPRLEPWL